MSPFTAGNAPGIDWLLEFVFRVRLRPMLPPSGIVVGEVALTPNVACGEVVALLSARSQGLLNGPALHPHQLFMAVASPVVPAAEPMPNPVVPGDVFPKMRLRDICNETPPEGLSGPT